MHRWSTCCLASSRPVPTPRANTQSRSRRKPTMSDQPFTAQLAELEQAVRAARAEQRELDDQRDQAQQRAHDLRALLAARPAGEFDASGAPKPKTDARRLQVDIDAAANVLW